MKPDRWQRIDEIFGEICDLPAAERRFRLEELCSDDRSLRSEVEALLRHDREDGLQPPERPPGSALDASAVAISPGLLSPALGNLEIEDFELGEVAGRGGQGVVYLARQLSLDRTVALKVVAVPEPGASHSPERFRREAQAAARLAHPHIVRVHSYGEGPGYRYYAMEHVPGGTVADSIEEGRSLTEAARVREVARVGCAVAEALAYAHDRGVVHRDVKPSNILLDEAGEPKLADFGLSKSSSTRASLTQSGGLLGTPQYLSPEAIRGEESVGSAADVYAFGATLYHMLMGRPPYESRSLHETLRRIASEERAEVGAGVPRDLRMIVEACLEKDPADRYPDAHALATDLRRFLDDQPILQRPLGTGRRWVRSVRRHPGRVLAIVGIIAVTWVAIGFGWKARRLELRNEGMEYFRAAGQVLGENPRLSLLLALEGADRNPGLEANTVLYRALERTTGFGREITGFSGHQSWVRRARFDATGQRLVTASRDHTARVYEVGSGEPVASLRGHRAELYDAWFDDTGERVVTCSVDGSARVWRVSDSAELLRLKCGSPVFLARFVGRAGDVLTASLDGLIRVFSKEGVELWSRRGFPCSSFGAYRHSYNDAQRLAVSPNGFFCAALGGDGHLRVWDTRDGQALAEVALGVTTETRFARFSLDGTKLALLLESHASEGGKLSLAVFERSGRELWSKDLTGVVSFPLALAWHPDGSRVAISGGEQVLVHDETEFTSLWIRGASPHSLGFLPDGNRLFVGLRDGSVEICDVTDPARRTTLHGPGAPLLWATLNPEGRELIAVGEDTRVHRFDLTSGREGWIVHRLPPGEVSTWSKGLWTGESDEYVLCGSSTRLSGEPLAETLSTRWGARDVDRLIFATGSTLVALDGDGPPVTLWEAARGDSVRACAWNPLRSVVAVGTTSEGDLAGRVTLWREARGQSHSWRAHTGPVRALDFDAGGRRLASSSLDQSVAIWSTETGRELLRLRGQRADVRSVAFHPKQERVASGGWDGRVLFWDLDRGEPCLEIDAHSRSVEVLEWVRDGSALLSGSIDGSLRFWSSNGNCLSTLRFPSALISADLSPDGEEVLVVCADGSVRRVPYPPYEAADAMRPEREFYERELRLLGLESDAEEERSATPVDTIALIHRAWTTLREADPPWLSLRRTRQQVRELWDQMERPRFLSILLVLANHRVGDHDAAVAGLSALGAEPEAGVDLQGMDPLLSATAGYVYSALGEDSVAEHYRRHALSCVDYFGDLDAEILKLLQE